jgi:hypothetical protein
LKYQLAGVIQEFLTDGSDNAGVHRGDLTMSEIKPRKQPKKSETEESPGKPPFDRCSATINMLASLFYIFNKLWYIIGPYLAG